VTHDLAFAAAVADRIAVAYAGRIVEQRSASEIVAAPGHPYSRALGLAALPFVPVADGSHEALPDWPARLQRRGAGHAP